MGPLPTKEQHPILRQYLMEARARISVDLSRSVLELDCNHCDTWFLARTLICIADRDLGELAGTKALQHPEWEHLLDQIAEKREMLRFAMGKVENRAGL